MAQRNEKNKLSRKQKLSRKTKISLDEDFGDVAVKANGFLKSFFSGASCAGVMGVVGALIAGGITALCSGPVAIVAAVAAGVFGWFGAALAWLGAETSSRRDYHHRASWTGGLATAALLATGIYTGFGPPQNEPPKQPAAITQQFNTVGGKISGETPGPSGSALVPVVGAVDRRWAGPVSDFALGGKQP